MLSLKKIAFSTVFMALSSVALADDAPPNYFGAMGSYVLPDRNSAARDGYGLHVLYGSPVNQWLSIELNGYGHALRAASGYTGTASAYGAGLDVRGVFYNTPQMGLFALGGLGMSYLDLQTSGNKGVSPYFDAGLGLVLPITQNFSFRTEARYYLLASSQIINGQNVANEARFNAGLQFGFGDAPVAQAPVQPPPPPEEVHLVEVDSDGDGVSDTADLCPNTVPGTSVDEKGCPLAALSTPVVVDGDGDGVPDEADKCSGTVPGMRVDADGCVVKQTLVLRNINFATASGDLTDESKAVLDKMAEGMQGQPDMVIEIDGHTDAVGAQEYNLKLSQLRAKLVRMYLISKGVQPERMSVDGFGEFKPVADNKTEQGRALNRRVEFKVTRP